MKLFLFNCLCLLCLGTFACEQQAQSAANIADTTVHSAADEVVDEAPTAALADDEAVAEVDSVQDASTAAPEEATPANEKNETGGPAESTASTKTKEAMDEVKDAASSTERTRKTKPARRGSAKISFVETTHDFGVIAQGEKVEHQFVFENVGDADLEIINVDVTCGCTVPTFPFLPIPPGEKGSISVTYNSTGKLGSQKPMITVITNAKPRTHKLYFKGVVDAERSKPTPIGSEEN